MCILFIAFGGKWLPLNRLHCYMPCIYVEEKVLSVIHLFKSTQTWWIINFRQILYKVNIICLQYKLNDNFVAAMNLSLQETGIWYMYWLALVSCWEFVLDYDCNSSTVINKFYTCIYIDNLKTKWKHKWNEKCWTN